MSPDGAQDLVWGILSADVDDEVMRALSRREQRYSLYHLLGNERVGVEELADVLAGWRATTEGRVTTRADRDSLKTRLYHQYLPELDDVGLVSFDPEDRIVDRSPLSGAERELVETTYLAERFSGEVM